VIAVLREENWVERGNALGAYFLEGLRKLERHPIVKEARGRGMLLAFEFHPHESFSATSAYKSLLKQGFLVGYYPARNILRFDPALTIEKKDIAHLLDCLDRILETATQL
jgi:acetylornithine/succinyldiaminopimelate/putrescine aminotransferase